MAKRPTLTTTSGMPVADNQNTITAGPRGPVLMQDFLLFEKLAHQNRERIPERTVHAKGSAAYGTLTVSGDVTRYTKVKALSRIGKKTEAFLRFSTVAGERGAADAERDVRGFALRFYTEEGNWDIVGNNTPVFFVRDPLKFPDFIRTQLQHKFLTYFRIAHRCLKFILRLNPLRQGAGFQSGAGLQCDPLFPPFLTNEGCHAPRAVAGDFGFGTVCIDQAYLNVR